jgi:hypothetical protein
MRYIFSIFLIIICSTVWAEDLQNKDSIYYVAYLMANKRCEGECQNKYSTLNSERYHKCLWECLDQEVPKYIKMLKGE